MRSTPADHLITKQWQRLAEIQQVQLELLQEQRPKAVVSKSKRPKVAQTPAKASTIELEAEK